MSVIAFVSYATLKHGVPALLDFIRQTLLPITQLLSRTHVIGPIVSFLVRSTFFVWFMMLLASDRLLRSILSRLVGKHASGRRFSIINAMDPDFSLFDTAPDTIHDNDLPSPTNTYYSHSLAYSLCVASKLVYEDIPIIRHELDKAGFDVSDTFKPMAYLNICAFIVAKGDDILLVFRGTNPLNFQNYITNIHMGMIGINDVDGAAMGHVHKGFWRALGEPEVKRRDTPATVQIELNGVSLYRTVASALQACYKILQFLTLNVFHHVTDPVDSSWMGHDTDVKSHSMFYQAERYILHLMATRRTKSTRLFITGHSLGGALGTIFLAKMLQSKSKVLEHFGGLYTFGQPKIGDAGFAKGFDTLIEHKIFHHVYNNGNASLTLDIVPRVPSWLQYDTPPGILVFIDTSYKMTLYPPNPTTGEPVPVRQISYLHLSGLLNLRVIQRLPRENAIRILFRILFPFFVNDHFPSDYCDALRNGKKIAIAKGSRKQWVANE
ncbi:hypothetical protein LRAMOSA07832 [Lichtheimia ramosa]|uniref:Fungal lipase-type domain-containing protein n=1 Tax=Lichtheimia ramosa TaxID=688394 RepID=A0A077WDY5_9FUNG|nr:hypothetical protein LRAMOSA07832 [Lichtheimia ramosa]